MPIVVQDSTLVAAGAALTLGGAVPDGIVRLFRSVGVHNGTPDPVLLQIYLVPKAGDPVNSNRIVNRSVPSGKTDMCPELAGRGLNAGGTFKISGTNLSVGYTAIDTPLG